MSAAGWVVYGTTDGTGRVVEPGDVITDFRGETATFVGVDRGPEYNGTAKIAYRRDGDVRGCYDRVFDLTVTPLPDPGGPSGSTR